MFHILVALADRDRHGYSIMQDVAARTDGKVRLSAGTLYRAIRRMLEQGLIEELRDRPDPASDDERRRYQLRPPELPASRRCASVNARAFPLHPKTGNHNCGRQHPNRTPEPARPAARRCERSERATRFPLG